MMKKYQLQVLIPNHKEKNASSMCFHVAERDWSKQSAYQSLPRGKEARQKKITLVCGYIIKYQVETPAKL